MTDNEIIKALECCVIQCAACRNCPLFTSKDKHGVCYTRLKKDALALINRQQAEIVKLEAETDRLNYILQCYALEHGTVGDKERVLKEARDEAVKEFAKRVKEYPIECRLPLFGLPTKQDVEEYFDSVMMNVGKAIDNVAKELTEGKEDER